MSGMGPLMPLSCKITAIILAGMLVNIQKPAPNSTSKIEVPAPTFSNRKVSFTGKCIKRTHNKNGSATAIMYTALNSK